MLILPQTIIISWNKKNRKYYESLGYIFTKNNEKIEIDVLQLPYKSKIKVNCICDYCKKNVKKLFKIVNPNRNVKFKAELKDICKNHTKCFHKKLKELNLERYGVKNTSQRPEIKAKCKQTCLNKYGVVSPMLNKDIQEKAKQTCLKKFGTKNAFQSEIIKNKIKKTFLKRYNVETPSHSEEIQNRTKQTNLKKYGVEYAIQAKQTRDKIKQTTFKHFGVENILQSKEIRERIEKTCLNRYGVKCVLQTLENKIKRENNFPLMIERAKQTNLKQIGVEFPLQSSIIREKGKQTILKKYGVENAFQLNIEKRIAKSKATLYKNGNGPCSKQQRYFHKILGGCLNYAVDKLLLDIAFPKQMIYIEYDGGGHFVFQKNKSSEIARKAFLEQKGWKIIRYVSSKDIILNDIQLKQLIKNCKKYLLNSKHTWIEINIDNKKIKCAEYERELNVL